MVRGWMSPRHPPSLNWNALGSARHRLNRRMDESGMKRRQRKKSKPNRLYERAAADEGGSHYSLILFLARLLPAALASQGFLHTLFLAGFQVVGVPLDFLDDVFLLDLAFETAQSIFKRLTFLQSYICQSGLHPQTFP